MDASPPQRPWISLALSAALHAALLVPAVLLSRESPAPAEEPRPEAADPGRQVRMVYLEPPAPSAPVPEQPEPEPPPEPERPEPPPAPAPPPTPPRAIAPAPEKEQRTPEPDANAPPDAERSEGDEPASDDPAGGETAAPEANNGSRTTAAAGTMESEARRIFGRPRPGPRPGAGPRDTRPMEAYLPDHPERCIPTPSAPRDSGAPAHFGVAVGKIFRQDDGRPLSGAHLQMLGTPYVTFTDESGRYRFRFDMALVDNCRTQYVRVTAPGYESRLLVLVVGANVQSEDVVLKRR